MNTNRPPLILASGSAARREMLTGVGLHFDVIPANIDEQTIINAHASDPIETTTLKLAEEKALAVSKENLDALVIGSDQTLDLNGLLLSKAKDVQQAKIKLESLSGKTHTLRSAVAVAHNNHVLFTFCDEACLTAHDFNDSFLERYMDADPDALTSCVGAYKIEGIGAWLFDKIDGNHYTIMGMPLLPLLSFLRKTYGFMP